VRDAVDVDRDVLGTERQELLPVPVMLGTGFIEDGEIPRLGIDIGGGTGGEHRPVVEQRLSRRELIIGSTPASRESASSERHTSPLPSSLAVHHRRYCGSSLADRLVLRGTCP
jgi:hypothetical protein